MSDQVDCVVIGAGVVGCATALVLARRGLSVVVLEREGREGTGITSRNSGVIHSALYYPPESLKARLCLRGQALTYAWLQDHAEVAHAQVGKLVIAFDQAEEAELEKIAKNAHASGATSVQLVSGRVALAREPALPANVSAALWCPLTGVVDAAQLTQSYRAAAEGEGCLFVFHATVTAIEASGGHFRLRTSRDEIEADRIVNAAGLSADLVARWVGVNDYQIYPCRGDYFSLKPARPFRHLIYPVKNPKSPGLGVHLTLDTAGHHRLGPDADYVESRDDFGPAEHKREAFRIASERLLGATQSEQLSYDTCGIRPKLRSPDAPAEVDFVVRQAPAGVVHLIGIESPGLTAAPAIAERVVAALFASE